MMASLKETKRYVRKMRLIEEGIKQFDPTYVSPYPRS